MYGRYFETRRDRQLEAKIKTTSKLDLYEEALEDESLAVFIFAHPTLYTTFGNGRQPSYMDLHDGITMFAFQTYNTRVSGDKLIALIEAHPKVKTLFKMHSHLKDLVPTEYLSELEECVGRHPGCIL